jgi:predicted secreted hydrolase
LRRQSAFEWWYFDLQTDDGIAMVIVFSRRNPVLSRDRPSLYVEYTDGSHKLHRVRNYAPSTFAWTDGEPATLRVGTSTLQMSGTEASLGYAMTLRMPEIEADLELHPMHRGFLPTSDGCYFRSTADASRRTCVSFSAPLMRVSGSVRFAGTSRNVSGRGYHDHPWGTEQIFFTHHQWNWARIASPQLGAMFADVKPMPGFEGSLCFFYLGEFGTFEPRISADMRIATADWRRDSLFGIRFPHQLQVDAEGRHWTLDAQGSLLNTPVYNRSRVRWQAGEAPGSGWAEYFDLPPMLRSAAALGSRIAAFFWRPFPYFGQ